MEWKRKKDKTFETRTQTRVEIDFVHVEVLAGVSEKQQVELPVRSNRFLKNVDVLFCL